MKALVATKELAVFDALQGLSGLEVQEALGFLPPILAAALQSIPDLLILGNSSRLLRQKP